MLGEKCGCCEGPWVHRDNHNSHMFHITDHRPKNSVSREFAALSPRGLSSEPWCFAHWCNPCQILSLQGPWWQRTTMTWSPWSDSRAWWVTRVGFLSIPVRPGILKTPKHFANHAQLLDQRICVMVVLRCHGSLQTETLAQVASVVEGLGVWWHPARVVPQLHANWILGPKVGSCRVKCVGVVKVPGRTGIITTTAHFTHISRPSAQGLSPQGVLLHSPQRVSSEPWCFCPLMQPGAKFDSQGAMAPGNDPTTRCPWVTVGIDGEMLWGVLSKPVPRMLTTPAHFTDSFPNHQPKDA